MEVIKYKNKDIEAMKILEDFLPDKIIDAHAHISGSVFLPSGENDKKSSACFEIFRNEMSRMLCNPSQLKCNMIPFPDKRMCNQDGAFLNACDKYIVSYLENNPGNVGEIMVLPSESAESIEKRLVHPSIKGFKCYHTLADAPVTNQLAPWAYLPESAWQVAEKNGMCITLHLVKNKALSDRGNMEYIKTMAARYPNAKLILAHCARAFAAWTCIEAIEELIPFENVFFDFSAICEPTVMIHLLNKVGVERCMWGSDFPICAKRGKAVSVADGFLWLSDNDFPENRIIGIENLMAVRLACIISGLKKRETEKLFYETASEFWCI